MERRQRAMHSDSGSIAVGLPLRKTVVNSLLRLKHWLLGTGMRTGVAGKALVTLLLIDIGFVYLYPVLYMVSTMMMTLNDLVDPTVIWVPTEICLENISIAFVGMEYMQGLAQSALVSIVGAVAQAFTCALAGYGLSRYHFRGRNLVFAMVLLTFIVPPQTIIIPLFLLNRHLGWLNTNWALVVPEMFGLGLKGALFVIIYRQFFLGLPSSLDEAARLDGAGGFAVFTRVMLPISKPAILVVSLFSVVWHWNDYYLPTMLVSDQKKWSLVRRLHGLGAALDEIYGVNEYGMSRFSEPIEMAGAFLVILPILLLYLIAQRWFTESIERTGLVE